MDNNAFIPDFGAAPQQPQPQFQPQQPIATPEPMPQMQPQSQPQPMQSQPMAQETVMDPTQYQPYDFTPNQQLNYNPTAGIDSANIMDNHVQMANVMTEEDQIKDKLKFNRLILAMTAFVAIILACTTVLFFLEANNIKTDISGQINKAVAIAVNENTTKLQDEFAEKEKQPYKTFAGPSDYGELTFEYPKTWSVYVSSDASKGGEYAALLSPDTVVANSGIYALRVNIKTGSTDSIIDKYTSKLKSGELTSEIRVVNGINATVYTGAIDKNINGFVAIFKIRDKTVMIQTDAQIFREEFNHILDTTRFNS